jgi:hypothetical protein
MQMRTRAPSGDEQGEADNEQSPPGGEGAGTADVARYVADMTAQLEAMATAAKLDFLAYLLSLARAESETIARGQS